VPAHYVVIEGLELPAQLGGYPALDFCNTLVGWDGEALGDYLESYDHLAVWAGFVGLLTPVQTADVRRRAERDPRAAAGVLEQAAGFRARLYDVLRHGAAAHAFELVVEDVRAAAASVRLDRSGEAIRWHVADDAGMSAPQAAVAWSAGELLTSPDLARVRACPGTDCGWLFLNRSGRRRWCTMATCGNRAKVRRFAARRRGTG
jgi:predicted RNA-binding Zn ribbon-like protein